MTLFFKNLASYSGMIAVAVLAGSLIPLLFARARGRLTHLLSLSAGIMLGATLIHLLPASIELIGARAPLWVLVGFLFLYAFEKFVTVHICEAMDCEVHTMGIAAGIGISAHALADGVALGSGLLMPKLGLVVFLAIFFHKLPEALSLTSILLHEAHGRARILFFNILLILMVPLGAAIVYALAGGDSSRLTGIALAFAAGTFLHISLSDLLPEVHKERHTRHSLLVYFFVGLAFMYALEWVIG